MKIGVVGSGIMGNGIAQVFAMFGYSVVLVDLSEGALAKAKASIVKSLVKLEKKQQNLQTDEIVGRVQFTTNKHLLADADVIIEAIIENIEVKKELFRELDGICHEKTVFASNTSSLSITEMASSTTRPGRVCGLHFFNPVPLMELVEITSTEQTSDETISIAEKLVESIQKKSIRVRDTPLFVVNRLLVPLICEAIALVDEGIATAEDIDKGMKLGANHPIGPLKLADLIGLDTMLNIQQALYDKTKDPKYTVPDLLKRMVNAGNLGKKSGKGFYQYS